MRPAHPELVEHIDESLASYRTNGAAYETVRVGTATFRRALSPDVSAALAATFLAFEHGTFLTPEGVL